MDSNGEIIKVGKRPMNKFVGKESLHSPRFCVMIIFTAHLGMESTHIMKVHTLCNGNIVQSVRSDKCHTIHDLPDVVCTGSTSCGRRSGRSTDPKKWFLLLRARAGEIMAFVRGVE